MITTKNLTKETRELRKHDDILNNMENEYLDILDYEMIKDIYNKGNKELYYIGELNSYAIAEDLDKHIEELYYISNDYDDLIEYLENEYCLLLPETYFI